MPDDFADGSVVTGVTTVPTIESLTERMQLLAMRDPEMYELVMKFVKLISVENVRSSDSPTK